jgi:S-DNA-T family DNA segregation ATPase FtsK/SpoIIIE
MRRQARRARRMGMQPMMVINPGDPLPEVAAVAAAKAIWRYRSELAPAAAALLVAGFGLLARTEFPQWWPLILATAGATGSALAALGKRTGLVALQERLYLAVTVLACGTWDALAAAQGPLTPPLPQALGAGWLLLSVPWWANRRRRAKVRVERAIAAWPDIAQAVGLAGSQIMAATVDLWGWRGRLRLARGQTITDVMAKTPAIESGLGTHRNAIRVHPTPDDLANRCEIRVLDRDPHADAIPWPGPSVTSITEPIDLGPFEDAEPCRVLFLRRHALLAGATGSGKSTGLNDLIASLAACRDVIIWAIDLKRGMELQPWAPCLDRLATTPPEAAALLADAVTILYARAEHLTSTGKREWHPTPAMPALVIVIDEYAELDDDAIERTDTIARLGRAPAVTLVIATQRPTQDVMGHTAVRSQMNIRVAFRVEEPRDTDLTLGQGKLKAGWHAHTLNAPGKFLVSSTEHATPRRARAYLLTDNDVQEAVNRYAPIRPRLDTISRQALTAGPPPQGQSPAEEPLPGNQTAQPGERHRHAQDPQHDPDTILRRALTAAPPEGTPVADLITITGMSRRWVFYRLRQLAATGNAIQTVRGQWRATR